MNASYIECSSKEMRGVDAVFQLAVDTVVSFEEQAWEPHIPASKGSKPTTSGKKVKKRSCKIL